MLLAVLRYTVSESTTVDVKDLIPIRLRCELVEGALAHIRHDTKGPSNQVGGHVTDAASEGTKT